MEKFLTPKQAAEEVGIKYPAFLARVRKGKIKAKKFGWALMIPRSEVNRLKREVGRS